MTDTLFLTGTGRSGTNILKQILGQHADVASLPFEYRFLIDPDGVMDFYRSYPTSWTPYRADKAIKRLEHFLLSLGWQDDDKRERSEAAKEFDPSGLEKSPPPYSGWELEKWIPGYRQHVNDLIDRLRTFEYRGVWPGTDEGVEQNRMYFGPPLLRKDDLRAEISEFIASCLDAIRNQQGKPVFQEDNTHNMLYATDLLACVPDSRMIHIVRDPRDVLSSLKEQRWAPSELPHLIDWYIAVMGTWFEERSRCPEERYLEIRFEDLIADPKTVLQSVCSFAGLDWDDKLLEVDLSKHNIGRYSTSFKKHEVELIERELQFFMEAYNYPIS